MSVPGPEQAPVTVVVPTRNRPRLLAEAVASARAQTLPPAEIVVVDDGSDPGQTPVLDALEAEGVRVLRSGRSHGGSAARNKGWRAATQPLVAFLDDDDLFVDRKLELQLPVVCRPEVRWSWTDYRQVDRDTLAPIADQSPRDPTFAGVLARSDVSNCTLLVERTLLEQVGGYDESLPRNQDRDLVLRLLRAAPGAPVPEGGPLTLVRWHRPDPAACIRGEAALHAKWAEAIAALSADERRRIAAERHWLNWTNRARMDDRAAELREIASALRLRPGTPRYWRSLGIALLHLVGWRGRHTGAGGTP